MESQESVLLKKIQDIVFSIPDELFKYSMPDTCFKEEWEDSSPKEKAYLLIQDELLCYNGVKKEANNIDTSKSVLIRLGKCPSFYSCADENMFFNAIYSIQSFLQVVGRSEELILYSKESIRRDEIEFLINLFKRYNMEISNDLLQLK